MTLPASHPWANLRLVLLPHPVLSSLRSIRRACVQDTLFRAHSRGPGKQSALLTPKGTLSSFQMELLEHMEEEATYTLHASVLQGWLPQRISNLCKISLRGRLLSLWEQGLISIMWLFIECLPNTWGYNNEQNRHGLIILSELHFKKCKLPVENEECVFFSLRE